MRRVQTALKARFMAILQKRILQRFLEELGRSPDIDPKAVDRLRELLAQGKRVTVDDLAKALSVAPKDVP
jgi:hypothetical protein